MTTTGDERRDVAENLRYMNQYVRICYKEQFFDDLIDPTCVMHPVLEGFRCSACGTYHDTSGSDEFPWPRCPECGT